MNKNFSAYVWIAAFLAFPQAGTANPMVLWAVASGGNGHYYQTVPVPGGINWAGANASAIANNGYLCTITSDEENTFVANLVQADTNLSTYVNGGTWGPWLGGLQPPGSPESEGGWSWVSGEPWTFTAWSPGEPNNYGDEDRVMFYEGSETTNVTHWNDQNHDALLPGYIIEYDSFPADSTIRFSEVEVSWYSMTNTFYRVEYASSLNPDIWNILSNNIPGDGTTMHVPDKISPGQSQRFYRVRTLLNGP